MASPLVLGLVAAGAAAAYYYMKKPSGLVSDPNATLSLKPGGVYAVQIQLADGVPPDYAGMQKAIQGQLATWGFQCTAMPALKDPAEQAKFLAAKGSLWVVTCGVVKDIVISASLPRTVGGVAAPAYIKDLAAYPLPIGNTPESTFTYTPRQSF